MVDLKDPENWNVRMIQNGEFVYDTLYSPYIPISIGLDELEGYFYKKDYGECKKLNHEDRSSYVYPAHNSSIKLNNYFSVSVSLPLYIKMLKGEKSLPKGFSKKERIERIKNDCVCFLNYGMDVPLEIINYCRSCLI